jgi:hypothetical protein
LRTSCNSYLIPGTRVHNSISELSILRDVSHLFTACSEKFASLSFYPIAIELSNKRGLEARLILLKCERNIFMTIFQYYFRTVFKFLTISGTRYPQIFLIAHLANSRNPKSPQFSVPVLLFRVSKIHLHYPIANYLLSVT